MACARPESGRIVVAAIAIAMAGLAAAAQPAWADPISHSGLPSVLHDVNTNAAPLPEVSVTSPPPPAAQQLADSLYQFIVHHATTHYVTLATTRNLARWRGGRQSICPLTGGLGPADEALVTARVRALAAYVGAPVQADAQCAVNVQILFTGHPGAAMDEVMQWATATSTFGLRYSGGMRDLVAYTGDHAIEGWYLTTRGGARVLNTDTALLGLDVLPVWPQITPRYLGTQAVGTRLGGSSGSGIGIGVVILIVDTTKVGGYPLGTLADYLAMLTLTVVQSPDHCDALPSILDLMSSGCGTRAMPAGMTAADLAFLKALYYRNTGLGPSLSRAEIQANMLRQFGLR